MFLSDPKRHRKLAESKACFLLRCSFLWDPDIYVVFTDLSDLAKPHIMSVFQFRFATNFSAAPPFGASLTR